MPQLERPDGTCLEYFLHGRPNVAQAVYLLHHGAGMSLDSWGPFMDQMGDATMLAWNARCCSKTRAVDVSMEAMIGDVHAMAALFPEGTNFVLVGHSLGGAVMAKCAMPCLALILIDAVEEACKQSLLRIESRIHTIKNVDIAAILGWKQFWPSWFDGLTRAFLSAPVFASRVLITSTTGAVEADKELLIAQMQGRFQFHCLPHSTHFVHEERAHLLAPLVLETVSRALSAHSRTANK